MEDKIQAIQTTINRLADIGASINKDIIDDSSILTSKVQALIASLQEISKQASIHDYFGDHGIPINLLEHLDELNNNPDLFTIRFVEECAEEARKLKVKANYLEEIKRQIEAEL